jgi:hypothetical protein
MTKTIKITSIVAAILLIVGTLFKLSHWPGANVLIVIGAATGILLFLLIISAYFGKLAKGYEQFTGIFASLVLIVSLLAFMFKMMHWPGAAILIWIADIGILFAGAFFLVDGAREKEAARSVLKIIAGFFILLLSLVIILAG